MSGDFTLEDSVHIVFTTRAFATGIPSTLSAATVAVYEDITPTPIESALAVTEDLNSVTGLNAVSIAALAASGYNAGGHYHVVIDSASTVGGVSVQGEVVGSFTIAASAAAEDLANGTDGLGAIKADTAAILVDTAKTGYESAAIWLDPTNGTDGTTDYTHGTVHTPCLNEDDVLTIAASLNLTNIVAVGTSTVVPSAAWNNFAVFGSGYGLTLGGFDYAGTTFSGASPVAGIAVSSANAGTINFIDCVMNGVTVDDAIFTRCGFTGDLTLSGVGSGTPGEVKLVNCFDLIPSATIFALDFGVGTEDHDVIIDNWQNDIEIKNFNNTAAGATDKLTISGTGALTIASTCDGGTINLRGQWVVTDNSGAAVTIVRDEVATDTLATQALAVGATGFAAIDTVVDATQALAAGATGFAAIDTVVDGIQTDLSNGTDGLGAIKAETALILTDTGTTLQAELDAIQAAVITNAAGADIAADIIAVKAETANILTDTGTTIPGTITTAQADLDIITGTAGVIIDDSTANDTTMSDAIWDEARSGHTTAGTYGEPFALQLNGTCASSLTTNTFVSDLSISVNDQYVGRTIMFGEDTATAALQGQTTDITGCTAATNLFTFTALTTVPGATDTFVII